MSDDDAPTVEFDNAETGDYLGEGEVVKPDLLRWQRGSYRFKRTVSQHLDIVFLVAITVLIRLGLRLNSSW